MPQLGPLDHTLMDVQSNLVVGASVEVFREGATIDGSQSGSAPLTLAIRHPGKIIVGDTVFLENDSATVFSVTAVTLTTMQISGFVGVLSVLNNQRIVPSNNQPTIYSDDQGGASVSQPLTSDAFGSIATSGGLTPLWTEGGAYHILASGAGATPRLYQVVVIAGEAPSVVYSGERDGATAVAHTEDTRFAMTVAGAKLKSWRNLGVERNFMRYNGVMAGEVRFADSFASGSSTGGIQEAINDLSAGGTVVLSGPLIYLPTAAITLKSNLTIIGNGATIQRGASLDGVNIFKDAGSALSRVSIRDITFDNNSRATTVRDIELTGGCTDIDIERNRWINLTNRVSDLVKVQTSASKGARIRVKDNTVVGPGGQQTYNSFQVFDCDNVDASENAIDGWGAIKLEGSLGGTLYNWAVQRNRLKNIAQSNIFCRIQGAASIVGINVSGNAIVDSGKTAMAIGAINAGDTGTIDAVSVTGNTVRGFALSLADSAIALGGLITTGVYYMTGVTVTGNSINGLDSSGAQPADQFRGIAIGTGIAGFSVTGNVVKNCGRDGILVVGAKDGVVGPNEVDRCVKQDTSASAPTPSQEGGISIGPNTVYACKNVQIVNNVSKNNGVSAALKSYGINVGPNYGGTIQNITVRGNRCFDDQGTQTQDYGIIIGSGGNPGPNDSIIEDNDCRGNATGGITGPLGTATGVFLRRNVPNDGITRNITAVGNAITPSADRILLTADNSYTLTSAPTILDGYYNGQEIEIMNVDPTDVITVQDQGSLASSNLRLGAASRAIGPRDSLRVRFDSTVADWVETGFSNVT